MKKLLILSLFIFLSSINSHIVSAGEYISYQEIEFEHKSPRFLDDYTKAMYTKYYKKIDKKKFWGWRTHTAYKTEKVTFTKETLYIIYNEGETAITENFSFKSKESTKKQYNVSGTITLSAEGEEFGFKLGLEDELAYSITSTTDSTYEEEFSIKVYVDTNTQLLVQICGEGKISNGVAKYYRFWRSSRKGGWEVFIVTTEYYSLRKELINES